MENGCKRAKLPTGHTATDPAATLPGRFVHTKGTIGDTSGEEAVGTSPDKARCGSAEPMNGGEEDAGKRRDAETMNSDSMFVLYRILFKPPVEPGEAFVPGSRHSGVSAQRQGQEYREGEPLRDLHKHLGEGAEEGNTVEVRIPADLITSTNRQVRARQLWGTDVYTDDSDLVAVLMHTGFYLPTTSPPTAIVELRATLKPLSPKEGYASTPRNSIRSRAWGAAPKTGCSYRVERCLAITPNGAKVELDASLARAPAPVPTFIQSADTRIVKTRSAASSQEQRRMRLVQEVTVKYNLCNEPWMKYSMNVVADRGLKVTEWTSARLRKEILFVETHMERFELSCDSCPQRSEAAAASSTPEDTYRWARCKTPHTLAQLQGMSLPLPLEEVEVIASGIVWEDIRWSASGVIVLQKAYPIVRVQFLKRTKNFKS
eukprot:gene14459-17089_t